jgi:uncharacterized membrane protein
VRRELLQTRSGRLAAGALATLVVVVVVGLVTLWPTGDAGLDALVTGNAERAEVEQVARFACPMSQRRPCQGLTIRLASGPNEGDRAQLTLPGTDTAPEVSRGDSIRVMQNDPYAGATGEPGPDSAVAGDPGVEPYAFVDFERRSPLYLLAIIFAVCVVLFGRWKGLRSLVGLVLSLALVLQFIVPAILQGSSPVLVGLVGALAVMLVTIALAHGTGVTSVAALLGSTVSLLAVAALAVTFVELAQITGFSSEEASLLRGSVGAEGGDLSLQGLVLAGMLVAALGVLDDVTVSQSSTVMALQRANPLQSFRQLFEGALSVGRDHLSATVNTLVLAYVGAALPIFLIFENQGTSFGEALNRESVAGEVVAMLVGSIGLILAVPVTSALAAWLARSVPPESLPEHGHAHPH